MNALLVRQIALLGSEGGPESESVVSAMLDERAQVDPGWIDSNISAIVEDFLRTQLDPGYKTSGQIDPGYKTSAQIDPGGSYTRPQIDPGNQLDPGNQVDPGFKAIAQLGLQVDPYGIGGRAQLDPGLVVTRFQVDPGV